MTRAKHPDKDVEAAISSAEEAILTALADVRKALPDASLVEAGPDFRGLTDVADLLGMSRQVAATSMQVNLAKEARLLDTRFDKQLPKQLAA